MAEYINAHIPGEKPVPEDILKNEKRLKKIHKEGGKRGVEIEGAHDMGGLQFFCTTVDLPGDSVEWLYESVRAMNMKSEEGDEERKGGSFGVGKMAFSYNDKGVAVVAYVPEKHQEKVKADSWLRECLKKVSSDFDIIDGDANLATALMKADGEKGLFSIKMRDACQQAAMDFLKPLGLFPDGDDDDSEEMIFGDDDFPQA